MAAEELTGKLSSVPVALSAHYRKDSVRCGVIGRDVVCRGARRPKKMLEIHPEAHLDHNIEPGVVVAVRVKFKDAKEPFIETFPMPGAALLCRLHGPIMRDDPIPESEVVYRTRNGRDTKSRLTDRPSRLVDEITAVGDWLNGPGSKVVLFTLYGGPAAPREPDDPDIEGTTERQLSEKFWSVHALSRL